MSKKNWGKAPPQNENSQHCKNQWRIRCLWGIGISRCSSVSLVARDLLDGQCWSEDLRASRLGWNFEWIWPIFVFPLHLALWPTHFILTSMHCSVNRHQYHSYDFSLFFSPLGWVILYVHALSEPLYPAMSRTRFLWRNSCVVSSKSFAITPRPISHSHGKSNVQKWVLLLVSSSKAVVSCVMPMV